MITKQVRDYVLCECKKAYSGVDLFEQHINIVKEYAIQLANILGADEEVVELAAYLHDFSVVLDMGTMNTHPINGAQLAEKILTDFDYPIEKITQVKQCILSHSEPIQIDNASIEEVCLSNADALSQIARPAYWLYVFYGLWKNSYSEGINAYLGWADKNWNMIIDPAKELIKEKYSALQCLGGLIGMVI